MLRIRPIEENQASERINAVYDDIKKTFSISIVPLLFQYLANFEDYFIYAWEKMKANIHTTYFSSAYEEVIQFTNKEISEIYSPSIKMSQFTQRLHADERHELKKTVQDLQVLNAKLLVLTIGLREGVKGVIIGQEQLKQLDLTAHEVDIFDIFHTKYDMQDKEVEPASRMLAPLFGSQALAISNYPAFFTGIAQEMDNLLREESYLQKRVQLERLGMKEAMGLPYSLGTSYQEIMLYAGHRPHLNELIYILAETFPSQFPRMLITTAVMQIALSGKMPLATR